MAIQTTLADYRRRFYSRFDEGQSQYIDNATANDLINEARAHLHNWIVTSNEDYMVNEYVFTIVTNQADYALPADYFKDLKVFGYYSQPSSPQPYYWPLRRLMRGEYRGGSANIYRYLASAPNIGYIFWATFCASTRPRRRLAPWASKCGTPRTTPPWLTTATWKTRRGCPVGMSTWSTRPLLAPR
jgi:hypothetical protein